MIQIDPFELKFKSWEKLTLPETYLVTCINQRCDKEMIRSINHAIEAAIAEQSVSYEQFRELEIAEMAHEFELVSEVISKRSRFIKILSLLLSPAMVSHLDSLAKSDVYEASTRLEDDELTDFCHNALTILSE